MLSILLQIRLQDHREPPSKVESLSLAKHTVELELGKGKIVECNVLNNWTATPNKIYSNSTRQLSNKREPKYTCMVFFLTQLNFCYCYTWYNSSVYWF